MKLVEEGWPDKKAKIPSQCLPFWNFRDQISFSDGVLFKGEKVIIPKSMQPEMLKTMGSYKTRNGTKWNGINWGLCQF